MDNPETPNSENGIILKKQLVDFLDSLFAFFDNSFNFYNENENCKLNKLLPKTQHIQIQKE